MFCTGRPLALLRELELFCFLVSYWTLAHSNRAAQREPALRTAARVQSCATVRFTQCNRFYRTEAELECALLASTH